MSNRIYTRTEKSQSISHPVNQDSRFFGTYMLMNDDRVTVLVVADGVSSGVSGETASRNAVTGFIESFHAGLAAEYAKASDYYSICVHMDRVKEIVMNAVIAANQKVCREVDAFTTTGTTLSAVVILNNSMICVNVGDSPIYHYSAKTGEFRLISELQTEAEAKVSAGQCERYDAEYYNSDHILTNALGNMNRSNSAIFDPDRIRCSVLERISKGDRVLLGTDGCFGKMKEDQIWMYAGSTNGDLGLQELFKIARRDKHDDQTAILFCFDEEVL